MCRTSQTLMLTAPDERVRLDARRHAIVLARPLVRALTLALGGGLTFAFGWPISVLGVLLLAIAAAVVVGAVWRWERTRVVVTTEKLFVVTGTVRRRAAAVHLASVGAVELEQSLPGRLLGYGTILAGNLEIRFVPDPRRVCGLAARLGA